jgi:hypothetical protein
MVRNGGLGERNVVLNVTGAHAYAFADGALALLFQQAQYLESSRVCHGLERRDQLFFRQRHIEDFQYTEGIVNYISLKSRAGSGFQKAKLFPFIYISIESSYGRFQHLFR